MFKDCPKARLWTAGVIGPKLGPRAQALIILSSSEIGFLLQQTFHLKCATGCLLLDADRVELGLVGSMFSNVS